MRMRPPTAASRSTHTHQARSGRSVAAVTAAYFAIAAAAVVTVFAEQNNSAGGANKDDAKPLCEFVDGKSTCRCRPGLTNITIGGPLGRENIRVGNRTLEMRIHNCTSLHVYPNGFEAALRLRLLQMFNVGRLVLEPRSFYFPTPKTDNLPPHEAEEKQVSIRIHQVQSELVPESTFAGNFKIIEITGSRLETWQTNALGPNASVHTLRLNGTSVSLWEPRGIDRTRIDGLELHSCDVDTMAAEAVRDPAAARDATVFGCRFRSINSSAFQLGAIWRFRFTNNTVDDTVATRFVNATITGPDVIFRNNAFGRVRRHAFMGIAAANSSTMLRFVGNLINECEEEGLKFDGVFVAGTKTLNLSDTHFNTTCSSALRRQVTSWAPEFGEFAWVTGRCLDRTGQAFVAAITANLSSSDDGGGGGASGNKSFVNYVLPIVAGSSVAAVLLAAGIAAFVCCGDRRRRLLAGVASGGRRAAGRRGRARRTRSGVVLTDSWNFGTSDSTRSSSTATNGGLGGSRLGLDDYDDIGGGVPGRLGTYKSTVSERSSGNNNPACPRYVFPIPETRTYNISEHVEPFEMTGTFRPCATNSVLYAATSDCEYSMAAPPLPQRPPRRMDTFSSGDDPPHPHYH